MNRSDFFDEIRVSQFVEIRRHASADYNPVALFEHSFELSYKGVYVGLRNVRTRAVDIGFGIALDFNVDTALTFRVEKTER